MTKNDEFKAIEARLLKRGFYFEKWSPGDGKTRYILVDRSNGRDVLKALGRKEAAAVAWAFLTGMGEAERRNR